MEIRQLQVHAPSLAQSEVGTLKGPGPPASKQQRELTQRRVAVACLADGTCTGMLTIAALRHLYQAHWPAVAAAAGRQGLAMDLVLTAAAAVVLWAVADALQEPAVAALQGPGSTR